MINGATEARLAMLWDAIDRPGWVSPQLAAVAALIDPDFDTRARERIERRCPLQAKDALSMGGIARHVALGPGSIEDHSAKTLAALLRLCEQRASASSWSGQYSASAEIRQLVAADPDRGGEIAERWASAIAKCLRG